MRSASSSVLQMLACTHRSTRIVPLFESICQLVYQLGEVPRGPSIVGGNPKKLLKPNTFIGLSQLVTTSIFVGSTQIPSPNTHCPETSLQRARVHFGREAWRWVLCVAAARWRILLSVVEESLVAGLGIHQHTLSQCYGSLVTSLSPSSTHRLSSTNSFRDGVGDLRLSPRNVTISPFGA